MRGERSAFDGAIQVAGVIDRAEVDLLAACGVEGPDGRKRRDLGEAFVAAASRALAAS